MRYVAPMAKAVKGAESSTADVEVPFEEALKRLESIVDSMETEDLPLEMLLSRFEEGTRLAQVCQAKLADAELKIQRLEKDAAGNLALKPLILDPESPEESL
jgi:exodeoxyribonuclease VII small subunit